MAPAARVAESLRLEQIGFTPAKLLLRVLARMNVGEQVVPADDLAVGIAKWQAARLEPPVLAIVPSNPVLEFVRLSRIDRVLPGSLDLRQIGRVNGVGRAPSLQFVDR